MLNRYYSIQVSINGFGKMWLSFNRGNMIYDGNYYDGCFYSHYEHDRMVFSSYEKAAKFMEGFIKCYKKYGLNGNSLTKIHYKIHKITYKEESFEEVWAE